jgi:hypothetical protein
MYTQMGWSLAVENLAGSALPSGGGGTSALAAKAPAQEVLAGGERVFAPDAPPLVGVLVKGLGIGALVAALLHFWKGSSWAWSAIGLPIGVATFLGPHLRGYDTLHVGPEGIRCVRGGRDSTMRFTDVARVYRMQEQWIFESKPPVRRLAFHLRGHERHLREIAETALERATSLRLGWLDGIAKIVQLLR